MQKFLGARGLSHTSNNASSLQSAIGLVRYLRNAGDGKEAKQIQLIGEGEREPGARASGQESALGGVAGKDWKLRRMGWNASHGGVVQCRWGVHRLQVLGATRYVPCPGGTWVPVVQPIPLSSALWFFWVGVGRGWAVGRSMSHDMEGESTSTLARRLQRQPSYRAPCEPTAPRLQSSRSKLRSVSRPFPLSPLPRTAGGMALNADSGVHVLRLRRRRFGRAPTGLWNEACIFRNRWCHGRIPDSTPVSWSNISPSKRRSDLEGPKAAVHLVDVVSMQSALKHWR